MIGQALAAAADRLGADAHGVLSRIGGSLGDNARAASEELATLSGPPHKTQRARWIAVARAPLPPGFRGIDPSWIEAALAPLPERARGAVAAGGGDEIDVWLARWACAALPAMPPTLPLERPRNLLEAVSLGGATLRSWLEAVGRDQIAAVKASAGDSRPPRTEWLGPIRASIARCRGVTGDHAAIRIGARTIAPRVDSYSRLQLAVRLPREIGLVVGAELVAFAGAAVDECPTWTALAAD